MRVLDAYYDLTDMEPLPYAVPRQSIKQRARKHLIARVLGQAKRYAVELAPRGRVPPNPHCNIQVERLHRAENSGA